MGFFPFGVYLAYIHFMTTMPPSSWRRRGSTGSARSRSSSGSASRSPSRPSHWSLLLFVANWTNFFLPLALLTSNQQNKTISIGIQELIGASPLFNATVAAGLDVKLYMPQLALATFISMLPLLIVFLGAQRFLIRGQTVGAVKG